MNKKFKHLVVALVCILCVWGCLHVGVCVCVCFSYLFTFSMLHYMVILHALQLHIHNTVTYIYTYVQFLSFSIVTAGLISVF